ncbi:hypothetical protein BKA63DRAFT_299709 [Paraphoma chrysanthemicola]|nr:hypothetical protein BKA63DRAFT_299709 [Paraphoma chrysanthemicola]
MSTENHAAGTIDFGPCFPTVLSLTLIDYGTARNRRPLKCMSHCRQLERLQPHYARCSNRTAEKATGDEHRPYCCSSFCRVLPLTASFLRPLNLLYSLSASAPPVATPLCAMQDQAHNNMPSANSSLMTKLLNPLRRRTDSEAVESIRLRRFSAHVKDIITSRPYTNRRLLQSLKRVARKVTKREQPKQPNSQAASARALLDDSTPIYRTFRNASTTAVLGACTPALRPRSYDAEIEYIRQELLVVD